MSPTARPAEITLSRLEVQAEVGIGWIIEAVVMRPKFGRGPQRHHPLLGRRRQPPQAAVRPARPSAIPASPRRFQPPSPVGVWFIF